jgi:class 3 adenylate cyclase
LFQPEGRELSETRKLAAILVADVVRYSRLAGADEERILARLRALRSDLIDPIISVHHGRIVKRTGDGSIIEFRSVVGCPSMNHAELPSLCDVSLMAELASAAVRN